MTRFTLLVTAIIGAIGVILAAPATAAIGMNDILKTGSTLEVAQTIENAINEGISPIPWNNVDGATADTDPMTVSLNEIDGVRTKSPVGPIALIAVKAVAIMNGESGTPLPTTPTEEEGMACSAGALAQDLVIRYSVTVTDADRTAIYRVVVNAISPTANQPSINMIVVAFDRGTHGAEHCQS